MDEKSRNIFYIVQGNEATEEDYLIEIAQRIIDETVKYCGGKEQHVETCVLLSHQQVDKYKNVDYTPDGSYMKM